MWRRDSGRSPRIIFGFRGKSSKTKAVAVTAMVGDADRSGPVAGPASCDDLQGLVRFRRDLIDCLRQRRDALFELTDALICAPAPVSSIPALSLGPGFRRGWGSLYAALTHGRIDRDALAGLLARCRPRGWPLVFAVDTSCWARGDAETSPDRG